MCVHLSHQVVVIHEARCYSPICTEDEDFLKEKKKKKLICSWPWSATCSPTVFIFCTLVDRYLASMQKEMETDYE